jgi:hypothetical protein
MIDTLLLQSECALTMHILRLFKEASHLILFILSLSNDFLQYLFPIILSLTTIIIIHLHQLLNVCVPIILQYNVIKSPVLLHLIALQLVQDASVKYGS